MSRPHELPSPWKSVSITEDGQEYLRQLEKKALDSTSGAGATGIKLHKDGEKHARSLIEHGKVNHGPWSFDKADGAKLLGPKGTDVRSYALHHLGEDRAAEEGTAERFKHPMAKDGEVYTRALRSIRDSAKKAGNDDVSETSGELYELAKGDKEEEGENSRPLSADREVRCLMAGLELRAAPDGSKSPGTIVGYAAVFGKFSEDLGYFREKIAPGAFTACLRQDVRALKNHDPSFLLGRSTSKTLRMVEDEFGLKVEIDLPDTQVGRDTAVEVGRGDMDGQSFSFTTDIDQWDYSGDVPIRTLIKVRTLYDVGPVTYPAYTDTSAAMRSLTASKPPTLAPAEPVVLSFRQHHSHARARLELAEAYLKGS